MTSLSVQSGDEHEPLRTCRRCLLKEFDRQAYMEKLHRYIEGMDRGLRASDECYEKRLSICKECEKLLEGTCLACGCYVELRAAVKKNRCPYKRW